jgi:tetratricopeptide (TPR) repeat protein
MFRGNLGTIVIMVVCFVVIILIVQTFKEYTPFAAVEEIIREKPPDYFTWGNTHLANKEYDKAIANYTEAIKLDPKDARPHERLAWVLATVPKDELRDGKKAVDYATKACELTVWQNPEYLATLAAAIAESGDFKEAIKWQMRALEAPGLEIEKGEGYRQRLKMFEEGKPYREKS